MILGKREEEKWMALISRCDVDAISGVAYFKKSEKKNMRFLKDFSKMPKGNIPRGLWSTIHNIDICTSFFSSEELSDAIRFSKLALANGAHVNKLDIDSNSLTVQQRDDLCSIIPLVNVVKLRYLKLNDEFFKKVIHAFETCKNSKASGLAISNCNLDEQLQLLFWDCAKYIEKIEFLYNPITSSSMKHLADMIIRERGNGNVKKLDCITLHDCQLDDPCLMEVARFAPLVKRLYLGWLTETVTECGMHTFSDMIV